MLKNNNDKNFLSIHSLYQKDSTLSILIIAFLLIIILLFIFFPGKVLTANNFQSMAYQLPELGILSLAIMITMLSGGINLSIIVTANMAVSYTHLRAHET